MLFQRLHYYYHFLRTLFTINVKLLWGMWRLTRLPQPAITVFGGARIKADSEFALKAAQLTKLLVHEGFSIVTGGGPGIMEAANFGALEYLKECKLNGAAQCQDFISAGIGLIKLNKEQANPYVQENIVMDHFFTRKWLLVRYSVGFVVFPGGFGTLDELFELVTLKQTRKMQDAPIILIDTDFWQPLMDWVYTRALPHGLVSQEEIALIMVVDTVETAIEVLKRYHKPLELHYDPR